MRWNAVKKIIFTAYFLHLFAVNAVNRGELFFFTAFSVAVNYSFSPLNAMNYFFFTASSGEKKKFNRHQERGEKKIHRDSPHSPQKDVRNTRWKLFFFSPHFTAFLTKNHRVFYEFTLLNLSYLNQRFSWFFCQTSHHQTAHYRQSPSATIFYCSATFTHFFLKLFKSFRQNR